ncbi:MAG: antitoxin VbhA family protein [Lachnospiraceae bacterium]|nr:antitoxin VbhA family protein [Lachnospiraceae bacterium]
MAYSQSQNRATQKYVKNTYDEIKVRISKGRKALYQQQAKTRGVSLNSYIISLPEGAAYNDAANKDIASEATAVKQVAATMAIEEMYFSQDFIDKMLKVATGEISSEEVRQELLQKYAR